jgi:hypothetical protein
MRHAPTRATRLLLRLGPQDESFIGDLMEEYRAGRSRTWYWRQVLSANLVGAAKDIRGSKLRTLRAVVLSWVVLIAWISVTRALYLWVDPWAWQWVSDSAVLRRAWYQYGWPLNIVWCLGALGTGWMTARWHRERPASVVLACAVAQLPWVAWWSWSAWNRAPHMSSYNRFPLQVCLTLVLVGLPLCTLLGGVSGADESHTTLPAS